MIIGGLYVWSLVTGFTGLCGKFWQFVAVRATEGLGETFYIPASVSLISDYHGPDTRSRAIGIQQTSIYAGTIFGGALAGWMASRYGWQSPFIFLGSLGIVLGLVLARISSGSRRGGAAEPALNDGPQVGSAPAGSSLYDVWSPRITAAVPPWQPFAFGAVFGLLYGILLGSVLAGLVPRRVIPLPLPTGILVGIVAGLFFARRLWAMFGTICQSRTARLLLLGFVGTNSVFLVFITWVPTYLHDVYGKSLAEAGFWANFPIQTGSMVGAIIGGLLADRLRKRLKGGRILVQGIGTLLGIPFLVLLGIQPEFTVTLVAFACFGIAKGIHDANISAGIFDVVAIELRAAAVGLLNFVGWGAGAIWTIGFGAMVNAKVPMKTLIGYNAFIYAFVCLRLHVCSAGPRSEGRSILIG